MTPNQRVSRIIENTVGRDLTSWERYEFLPSIRNLSVLSAKREKILYDIEVRVHLVKGEEDEYYIDPEYDDE